MQAIIVKYSGPTNTRGGGYSDHVFVFDNGSGAINASFDGMGAHQRRNRAGVGRRSTNKRASRR